MQIKVKDFIDQVVDGDFISSEMQTPIEDLDSAIKQSVSDFQTSVAQNKLSQQIILVQGFNEEIQIRLESGIINLPFANINRVDNFFDELEAQVPLNLYLIVEAADLNQSKFRIDEVSSVSQVIDDPAQTAKHVIEMVNQQLDQLQANVKQAEEKG